MEVYNWFAVYLESPSDHLPYSPWLDKAICWFKPTARELLARAWDLVAILERNDVLIWTIRSAEWDRFTTKTMSRYLPGRIEM